MKKALIELMDVQSFEKITVSRLTKKAGVSRSTFYNYCSNKTDLVHLLIRHALNDFDKQYHPHSIKERLGSDYIHKVWHYLLQDKQAVYALYKAGLADIYLEEINQHLLKLYPYQMTTQEKIELYGMAGAQYNIIFNLFVKDNIKKPKQM